MTARSFLGAGDIYINRIVGGVKQGQVGPIYANKLSVQPNVEKKESTSKGRYDYGQTLESVNLQQPAELSMELKEVTGDILTMAFLGTSSIYSTASGTMTDQPVVSQKGFWVDLGHKNLAATGVSVKGPGVGRTGTYAADPGRTGNFTSSAVVAADGTAPGVYTATFTSATAYTLRNAAGTTIGTGATGTPFAAGGLGFTITAGGTAAVVGDKFTVTVAASGAQVTLVEGTDYKLNRPLGTIQLLAASTIYDGATLNVSGNYSATSGTLVKGATRAEVRAEIVFDGINQADGQQVTATIWEGILSADSEFDFLADDFGIVSLSGTCKTPVGKDAPFEVLVQNPVV